MTVSLNQEMAAGLNSGRMCGVLCISFPSLYALAVSKGAMVSKL